MVSTSEPIIDSLTHGNTWQPDNRSGLQDNLPDESLRTMEHTPRSSRDRYVGPFAGLALPLRAAFHATTFDMLKAGKCILYA